MKATHIRVKTYKSPGGTLRCPSCHSSNTTYSCLYETHLCFDCLELFQMEDAHKPEPYEPKIVATCKGGVYKQRRDGGIYLYTKEMEEADNLITNPPPDPELEKDLARWDQIFEENQRRYQFEEFMKTLTLEQIEELRRQHGPQKDEPETDAGIS